MERSFLIQPNKVPKCNSEESKFKDIKKSKFYDFSSYFNIFIYYLYGFLISLNFHSSELHFGTSFGCIKMLHSILYQGTLLGHNQRWKGTFISIDIPLCKFPILLSSGLLVAFLVLEFKQISFFILVGPNDPEKVKKF